jgi:AcrR family transcriptional regulator
MTDPEPSAGADPGLVGVAGESTRRAELVARLLEYSAAHGLSNMSLRPVAAAVGSSPRVLLYFFGSKEGLIREVLATSRARQMKLVEEWLREGEPPGEGSLERLWEWLKDPAHADLERLFFESYGRSLNDRDGAWADFGKDSVADWLPFVARMLGSEHERPAPPESMAMPTLALAVLRGLLLDLIATGDAQRVQSAFDLLCELVLDPLNGVSNDVR